MDWYYSNNGQQAGPVSEEQLAELFRSGAVKSTDLVWNETMSGWSPIGQVAAFASSAPAPAAPATPAFDTPPAMSAPQAAATAASAAAAPSPSPSLAPAGSEMPPNYLWQSIVVMVLCCIPLGIPALIFSLKVKPAYEAGDMGTALDASKKAKMWTIIALICGLISSIVIVGINIFVAVNGM